MGFDWKLLARKADCLNDDGCERGIGTPDAWRAIESLLGEENIRDAVDYFITHEPGAFLAEAVLKVIHSYVAMERCYAIYANEPNTVRSERAVGLLSIICDERALPWAEEFLGSAASSVRWGGLALLQTLTYQVISDQAMEQVITLLKRAQSLEDERIRERAAETLNQLKIDPYWQPIEL